MTNSTLEEIEAAAEKPIGYVTAAALHLMQTAKPGWHYHLFAADQSDPSATEAIYDAATVLALISELRAARKALEPLAAIANAYEKSELDEARPEWGPANRESVELFSGRGGRSLLNLQHAFTARAAINSKEP